MASMKIMLEIDRDSGALLNVLNQDGSPAITNFKERRKWNMTDIHISAGEKSSASQATPRMACGPGTCTVYICNTPYCFAC